MKKRILGVLLMLILTVSMGLTVSAASKETYFEENGIEYCWVRGSSTEKPSRTVQGYTWIAVREGNRHVTQIGACDEHNIVDHDCGDIWDRYERLEYKWQRVEKELLVIECRDQAGYSMEGARFILLKQNLERDEAGNLLTYVDDQGITRVTYENSDLICDAYVGLDGYAKIRFTEESERLLDAEKDFQQLMLGQILSDEQIDEYSTIQNRWYVNLVQNADEEYEVYSITEAPPVNITDYDELKNSNFGKLGEGFVPEYDKNAQIMYLRNSFRVGKMFVNIKVEGFQGEIPSEVRTNVDITGPHDFSKRVRKSSTLEDMRMGDYTVKYSEPVMVTGYTETPPKVTAAIMYPVSGETQTLAADTDIVTLHRDHANAEINVTYTYYPDHVHTWDEGVVTDPTCVKDGYITYTCIGYDHDGNICNETKIEKGDPAFGHGYEETIIEPTCTEDGYIIYKCVDCGDTYQEKGDPAIDHIYEEIVTKPTCMKEGYTTYTCIHCGFAKKGNYQDALGHKYELVDTIKVSCEQDGIEIYACERVCGETGEKEEVIIEFAKGHKPAAKPLKTVTATCTESGYDLYTCTECEGELKRERTDLPATGHSYDDGAVTESTCTEMGYTTYTCTNDDCGYSYKGEYKNSLGHKYTSKVVPPTKEREGYTLHTCSVCQDSYTDNVTAKLPAKGSSSSSKDKSNKKDDSSKNKNNGSSGSGSSGSSAKKPEAANLAGTAADALVVKFYDENNQPLNSGMVALYEGNRQLKSWSCTYDNVAVADNLEKYAKDGAVVAYTLKQAKAMDGYEVSKDTFTVQIQKQSGNLKIKVTKNGKFSKGSDVENGRDGKPIVSFYNEKETTQFAVSCQVSVEFDGNCLPDEAMMQEYMHKPYQFTLNWTDEEGKEKTESLTLLNGDSGTWKAKIPFGTQYNITATDPDGNAVTGFSENASGTLTAKQMDEKVRVSAEIQYEVQPALPKELEMNVVDSESGTPLRGANFELKDPDGEKIATFISRENGQFYMDDVFPEVGNYLMEQTKAVEGYAPLNGAIPVTVFLAYEPQSENNVQLLNQYKDATFAHQDVSEEDDGSFTIENDKYGMVRGKTAKKGGNTTLILKIIAVVAAICAGVAAYVLIKRKFRDDDMDDLADEDSLDVTDDSENIDHAESGDSDEE